MNKFTIVVGTRPEIIKMAPVIWEMDERDEIDCSVLFTRQHWGKEMSSVFFRQFFGDKYPTHTMECGADKPGARFQTMKKKCRKKIEEIGSDVVLVQGDTLSVLSGAMAGHEVGVPVGHVEAGLRSNDLSMPEENIRMFVDSISDYHFCPTKFDRRNLEKEGMDSEGVYVVGNTEIDMIDWALDQEPEVGYDFDYVVATIHRAKNVENGRQMASIFRRLRSIYKEYGYKVVMPLHPRSRNRLRERNISLGEGIKAIDPLSFVDMIYTIKESEFVVTDSGGVTEDANYLRKPAIVVRDSIERQLAVDDGSAILCNIDYVDTQEFLEYCDWAVSVERDWDCCFGEGDAGERIVSEVASEFL